MGGHTNHYGNFACIYVIKFFIIKFFKTLAFELYMLYLCTKLDNMIIIKAKAKPEKIINLPLFTPEFKEPRKIPEANIQAECYRQLTNKGIKCYLEYAIQGNRKAGVRGARFDMIILKENTIVAIVEFKSRFIENADINRPSKQLKRYESYGLPVILCCHMTKIPETIRKIEELVGNPRMGL